MDKKTLILKSALKLITENGFHGTPVSMIAKDSGVAAGTIYLHFKNKEDIFDELYIYVKADYNDAIVNGMYEGISVEDEYHLKWTNMVNYLINNPAEAKYIDQYLTSPSADKDLIKDKLEKCAGLKNLYERAITSSLIKDISYETVITAMLGTVNQIFRMHNSNILNIDEKVIEEVFHLFWTGIKK
ncbi:AcrR family transcriptional regulator [Clostridium algifaecis]|uniref:AcrR family transcriptional regulator n=1 Tax=Clostridium algifaecis TaxID=1472040 RepID=A0ABS4KVM3_9CLOT|nr:TetR/AcrR family transcriptional regulator [Clostridium algifaecis]MBP2033456.1 AcrR family transcriptional regulator [Clostridium algifaecis]